MDLRLLDDQLASADEPRFRAHQVWEWAARGAASYDEMTNLPEGPGRQALASLVDYTVNRHG